MQSSYAQSAYRSSQASSGSSYTVDRLVTTLFRDLATNENMVSIPIYHKLLMVNYATKMFKILTRIDFARVRSK